MRRDSPQASRSRHCRAGRPILSPPDPRLLRRRGSGSFQVPGSGPDAAQVSGMQARRTEAETFRRALREDGFWRQMAARPPRATRQSGGGTMHLPRSCCRGTGGPRQTRSLVSGQQPLEGFRRGRPPACRWPGFSQTRTLAADRLLRARSSGLGAAVAPEEVQVIKLEGDSCDDAVRHCEVGDGVECNVAQETPSAL